MFFNKLRAKTIAAEEEKAKFKQSINADIVRQRKLNKVLSNGVSLKVYHASGGK